jgi:hypothetical protein
VRPFEKHKKIEALLRCRLLKIVAKEFALLQQFGITIEITKYLRQKYLEH